ncbi:hypothetical protein HanXRQr2_Chr17g0784171 [Helianthus annuus]|uniref:Uncharacterized protein n=1 Tax=Helianthus annuus TaxID=4232 RepID=A0A9K3GSJ2_HELAN|nr:hypothetical protein HanXRQr2_Chr17g0784171 [Helianthus annuus]KAJ0811574.1 hypothetical protein HanPSC8_Chr17g0752191 [Helianthus annuus]
MTPSSIKVFIKPSSPPPEDGSFTVVSITDRPPLLIPDLHPPPSFDFSLCLSVSSLSWSRNRHHLLEGTSLHPDPL